MAKYLLKGELRIVNESSAAIGNADILLRLAEVKPKTRGEVVAEKMVRKCPEHVEIFHPTDLPTEATP